GGISGDHRAPDAGLLGGPSGLGRRRHCGTRAGNLRAARRSNGRGNSRLAGWPPAGSGALAPAIFWSGLRVTRQGHPARVRPGDLTPIVARALRDPSGPAPMGLDPAALVACASDHRVLLLLGWLLRAAGTLRDWPAQFIDAFRRAECEAITIECVREAEIARVLSALASEGVRALLLKGAALAHTHYPASHVRVRSDTDLFVPGSDVAMLESALIRLGYARPPEISGRLVSYQSHYYKTDRHGVVHALDVHWRISNLQALAD